MTRLQLKKKAIFVVPGLYPCAVGGAEVFNQALIKKLALECDVQYISSCNSVITRAKRIDLPFTRSLTQLFYIFLRLIKVECERTIVTSFMKTKWYYIVIYPLLAAVLNKNYIIIIHGGGMSPWKFKLPYRWYFKKARKVFGVSEAICKEYTGRTGVKLEYLPPLIPFSKSISSKEKLRQKHDFNEDENIFLAVGSLKNLKRPFAALYAAKYLGSDFLKKHKLKFIFAGDGPLKKEMQSFIQSNQLSEHISLLGNVPREKIHEFYQLSDNYIISSDFEGTPISMLEAMANRLLVIGSNAPGINNILSQGDMGYLFDNDAPEELAKIIESVVFESTELKKQNALEFYHSNFSFETMLNRIQAVL